MFSIKISISVLHFYIDIINKILTARKIIKSSLAVQFCFLLKLYLNITLQQIVLTFLDVS